MEKQVCVILVNYNGCDDTYHCVLSLQKCKYNNLRIIIVDNASEIIDEKFKKLEKDFENCEILFLEENKGFAGANNIGIIHSKKYDPDFILLLNNDTIVNPYFLKPLVKCFDDKNVGLATGKIYYYNSDDLWFAGSYFDEYFGEYKILGIGQKDDGKYDEKKIINFSTGCLMLISKEVIESVGLMSEDYFLYYEDADYCSKIIKNNYKIVYEPNSIIYHKESRSTKKGSKLYYYYILRNYYIYLSRHNNKLKYYLKKYYVTFKDVIRKRIPYKIALKAYKDFKKNKFGKCSDEVLL